MKKRFDVGLEVLVRVNGRFGKGKIVDVLDYKDSLRYEVFLEKNIGDGRFQEVEGSKIKVLRRKGGGK